jgi:hypothetical protein
VALKKPNWEGGEVRGVKGREDVEEEALRKPNWKGREERYGEMR